MCPEETRRDSVQTQRSFTRTHHWDRRRHKHRCQHTRSKNKFNTQRIYTQHTTIIITTTTTTSRMFPILIVRHSFSTGFSILFFFLSFTVCYSLSFLFTFHLSFCLSLFASYLLAHSIIRCFLLSYVYVDRLMPPFRTFLCS